MRDVMRNIEVECRFAADGSVLVSRICLGTDWRPVSQGRQWLDEAGRHVLVMLSGGDVHELLLRQDDLQWELRPISGGRQLA